MIGRCGMLGRSEGCFAVSHASLDEVLTRLGPGRLIYAGKAYGVDQRASATPAGHLSA
jgi:hypothetical protein